MGRESRANKAVDAVVLPRHKQQELLELIDACRDLMPQVQRIVDSVAQIAIKPEILKQRTAALNDATDAIERTKTITKQLAAMRVYVRNLERLTVPSTSTVQ